MTVVQTTLSPELISALEAQNAISAENGKKRTISLKDFNFEFPVILHSRETFEWLGFDGLQANDLWNTFNTKGEYINRFFEVAEDHMDMICGQQPDESAATCIEFMKRAGISKWLADAILMDEFEDLHLTATCKHWVIDSMQSRWDFLKVLERYVRENTSFLVANRQSWPDSKKPLRGGGELERLGSRRHL
jgi:hypothetical protein